MTLDDAKTVLGLAADDDPVARLPELTATREQLAAMIRTAPNDTIALRYQEGLQEFDRALAAVREEDERRKHEKMAAVMALVPGAVTGRPVDRKRPDFHREDPPTETQAAVGESDEPEAAEPEAPIAAAHGESTPRPPTARRGPPRWRMVAYFALFLTIGGVGGGWIYTQQAAEREARRQVRITFLEGLAERLVENRRWNEAGLAYAKIERLSPGSEVAARGRRSIEFGMREEQEQFVGYWSGEALAAFEAGRLDDAAEAADKVLARYPREREIARLRERIEARRLEQSRNQWAERIRAAADGRDWDAAASHLSKMARELPGDPLIDQLAVEVAEAREEARRAVARALELADAARLRDQGKFDAQALAWAREAVALAPDHEQIRALYEKLASYSRTLRVPDDYPDLPTALAEARDRDRVVLGEGVFAGGVVINVGLRLEGRGAGATRIEAAAEDAPVLTFGPGAGDAVVTGLTMAHRGFDQSETRYSAVQVRGAEVGFSDCEVRDASGHGLEAIEGGRVRVTRCRFVNNGWNGLTARGSGSRMSVEDSVSEGNFGHGFETWDEAEAVISGSEAKQNSRNGIAIDSEAEGLDLSGNKVLGNREYGILLAAGASGRVTENSVYANLLGGMLIRFAAISVVTRGNHLEENGGPGLILETGLRREIYEDNRVTGNSGGNVLAGVEFGAGE
jgi:parallel beta-helix repeat protein